jgi:hypothetical protein
MIALFADETGRVYLTHYKPELLSPERRAEAVAEVESIPDPPAIEDGFQAYLKVEDGVPVWYLEPRTYTEEEKNLLAITLSSRIVITEKVLAEALDDDTIAKISVLFPLWKAGLTVSVGDVYQWDGTLVECIQAHTTQEDWTPDVTPSLWKIHRSATDEPQPWVQPAGAHDAYQIGDKVTHNGSTWESTAADNVWEPGVYGWVEI